MCFASQPKDLPDPAPPPAPPEKPPVDPSLTDNATHQAKQLYGKGGMADFRRSGTPVSGSIRGGSGLFM